MSDGGRDGRPVGSARLFEFPGAAKQRNNLPTTINRVVGRDAVVERLLDQVAHARLITITGPGGIGKTTVALAVAERAHDAFPDGVWFVDFAPLRDASLVANAIAGATGLAVHSAQVLPALCRSLRHSQALLVLDNCEHLVASVASCAALLLSEAPSIRFIATSRRALQVDGELEHRLESLAAPPRTTGLTAALALTFPAVALFVERAADRSQSFAFGDADASTVAEICRGLDGIALAIELAAMRVDAFGVAELQRQLAGRLSVLAGRRAGLERHRTLSATLDWSYELLPSAEAHMLRAVSVFSGTFQCQGAAAAAEVAVDSSVALLAELASKSLLVLDVDAHGLMHPGADSGLSYRLLDTTRVYAAEKLAEAGEEPSTRLRHARFVCTTLERAATEWEQQPSRDWGENYRHCLDDLRVALAWTESEPALHELMIRLTSAGTLLWNHFSLTDESRIRLTRGLEKLAIAPGGAADEPNALSRIERLRTEMHLQFALAGANLYTRGIKAETRRAIRRALDISQTLDDTDFRLRCLRLTATLEFFFGEYDVALRTLGAFFSIAGAEDPSALAEGETYLGLGETFVGRMLGARQRMERLCAQSSQDFDDARFARFQYSNSVAMLVVLCHAQWLTGQPDAATRTAERILACGRQSTHELSLSIGLAWNSLVYLWLRDYDECSRHTSLLEELVERHGIVTWRPIATFCRGAVAASRTTERAAGIAALLQAVEEFEQIGHRSRLPFYVAVLAEALGKDGRYQEAEAAIQKAEVLALVQNDQWCLPEIHRIYANIDTAQGRRQEAETRLLQSISLSASIGALSWQLRAACDLACLWQFQSRHGEAASLLQSVLGRFTEGFGTHDLVAAVRLLAQLQGEVASGQEGA